MKGILLAIAFILSTSTAHAKNYWEIAGGSKSAIDIFSGGGYSATVFSLSADGGYVMDNGFEPIGTIDIVSGGGITATNIMGGVNYNFDPKFMESFYAGAKLGFANLGNSTEFALGFHGGKRFKVLGNVSWAPQVGLTIIMSSPSVTVISLVPVRFSVFF